MTQTPVGGGPSPPDDGSPPNPKPDGRGNIRTGARTPKQVILHILDDGKGARRFHRVIDQGCGYKAMYAMAYSDRREALRKACGELAEAGLIRLEKRTVRLTDARIYALARRGHPRKALHHYSVAHEADIAAHKRSVPRRR